MPSKEIRVLNAIKKRPGIKLSAREISKIANLTSMECGLLLSNLESKGLIQRIYVNSKDVESLWLYNGGQ